MASPETLLILVAYITLLCLGLTKLKACQAQGMTSKNADTSDLVARVSRSVLDWKRYHLLVVNLH